MYCQTPSQRAEPMALEVPNVDAVLDPPYAKYVVERHFLDHLAAARNLADYWADLLQRSIAVSSKTGAEEDLVVIAGFFRNGLKAYDGTLVCLESGAVGAAHVTLRALWEAELYTKWILKSGKERWGRQAYVADLRREREWNNRIIPGTAEAKNYESKWQGTFGSPPPQPSARMAAAAPARVAEIDALLALDKFKEINEWFDAARGARPWDRDWYKPGPGAPASIGDIAEKLDRSAEYLILYGSLSHHTHSSHPSAGFVVRAGGSVGIEPVRAFSDFPFVFQLATSLAARCLRGITEEYRAGEIATLNKKHAQDWAPRFKVPQVVEHEEAVWV
jgi:hypothetical protein